MDSKNISPTSFQIEKNKYFFRLLYVVLYDDSMKFSNKKKEYLEDLFHALFNSYNKTIERNSFNRIKSECILEFVNIKKIGVKKLKYNKKGVHGWMYVLHNYFKNRHRYNILSFSPVKLIEWGGDAPCFGFNYDGLIYFHPDVYIHTETSKHNIDKLIKKSIAYPLIHKTFHGLGYDHIPTNYKQLALLGNIQDGLPDFFSSNMDDVVVPKKDNGIFADYILKALGLIERDEMEKRILKNTGLVWRNENDDFRNSDENVHPLSYGSFCFDTNKNGVADVDDPYPFASPRKGTDTTGNGIIDEIDLCMREKIEVKGSKPGFTVLKLVVDDFEKMRIEFSSMLNIDKIEVISGEMIKGKTFLFPEKNKKTITDRKYITVTDLITKSIIQRIKVFYEHKGEKYYRPYFLYRSPHHKLFEYLYEVEWYYFERFGSDIPVKVNLLDADTYDKNRDGLPDKDKFYFAKKIDKNYDWDGDGMPDIYDPFPTIKNVEEKLYLHEYGEIYSPFKFNRTLEDPYELKIYKKVFSKTPKNLAVRRFLLETTKEFQNYFFE